MSLAVIRSGGKQYKVASGRRLKLEKLNGKEGEKVSLEALMRFDENGKSAEIGKPVLDTPVEAKIVKQGRAKKVSVVKYKPKTRYRRNVGHRQAYTEVEITKI